MEKVPIEKLREIERYLEYYCPNHDGTLGEAIKELEAYRAAESKPEPPANTVRVRIPVAVGADGNWTSPRTYSSWTEDHVNALAKHNGVSVLDGQFSIVLVEAYIPIPQPQTVEGTVSDDKA